MDAPDLGLIRLGVIWETRPWTSPLLSEISVETPEWTSNLPTSQGCSPCGCVSSPRPFAHAGLAGWPHGINCGPVFSQAIENIDTLTSLGSLCLGKNKITKLQNLDALTNLTVLSMQVLIRSLGQNYPAPRTLVFHHVGISTPFTTGERLKC